MVMVIRYKESGICATILPYRIVIIKMVHKTKENIEEVRLFLERVF